jgi:hypothetical protein
MRSRKPKRSRKKRKTKRRYRKRGGGVLSSILPESVMITLNNAKDVFSSSSNMANGYYDDTVSSDPTSQPIGKKY